MKSFDVIDFLFLFKLLFRNIVELLEFLWILFVFFIYEKIYFMK